ncbi:hypothetical protein IHE44_0015184 [Lamprotornis superbus]|uniref:RRM domain-containing protein n=1 Tax=Lamprotornis superbus TaxID=245042 RepID=A0A835NF21_9PASS|nr:hypothetical protein IHE44_0015184 [Lamprotornis superbus]
MASSSGTDVIQVTNVSPSASSEQMRTLFGFLGKIEELRLFPPDDSPLPVSSRVCFVKFHDPDSAVVAQHLTNTVFVDRALIVVPYAEGVIPDETKALSLLAPANAVAGLLPGGGLLPTPNPLSQIGAVPLAALGAPALDPALAALGLPGANLNSQSLAADQLLKLMSTTKKMKNEDIRGRGRARGGGGLLPHPDTDAPGADQGEGPIPNPGAGGDPKVPGEGDPIPERGAGGLGAHPKPGIKRRKRKKRNVLKLPPKATAQPEDPEAQAVFERTAAQAEPERDTVPEKTQISQTENVPVPITQEEKKKDKDKERSRDERERSTSKKKKSKDKEKDRDRKSESDKDVKVTRDYDEEEQGYDSEKEKKEEKKVADAPSPKGKEPPAEKSSGDPGRESKVNGDDHHEEDMDMSD